MCYQTYLNVGFRVFLGPLGDVFALFHLDVDAFKAEVLTALFKCVISKDIGKQRVEQVVETTISLSVEEFPLEDMMPSESRSVCYADKDEKVKNTYASMSMLVSHFSKIVRSLRYTADHILRTFSGIQ